MTANFINATTAYNKISAIKPSLSPMNSELPNTNKEFNQIFQSTLNNHNKIVKEGIIPSAILYSSNTSNNDGIMTSLISVFDNLRHKLEKSEKVTNKAALKKANLTDLVTTVSEAELQLQEIVYIRDKLVGIYKEIMSMQI
ncbi:Flagellar hook-basal body protein FliE [Rickettsiales bacterium Ac37b]|nr:Flagellar hook-basal body protein FliE [Rickettsiales bacterium Ac37b]